MDPGTEYRNRQDGKVWVVVTSAFLTDRRIKVEQGVMPLNYVYVLKHPSGHRSAMTFTTIKEQFEPV